MKHLLLLLASLTFVVASVNADSNAQSRSARDLRKMSRVNTLLKPRGSICPSAITLKSGQGLIKSNASGHIPRSDPRATGYTFICGSLCASAFPASIYYSNGNLAAKVGYYGRYSANGKPRAYCGAGGAAPCFVSSIYNTAKRLKTGASLYLKINSRQCIKFNGAPGARNGGV